MLFAPRIVEWIASTGVDGICRGHSKYMFGDGALAAKITDFGFSRGSFLST